MEPKEARAACLSAAQAAGSAIAAATASEVSQSKSDAYVGHHAIVTSADFLSQRIIFDTLLPLQASALLMTEEVVGDPLLRERLVDSTTVSRLSTAEAFVIDELDGTSSYASGHYEWSVSVGFVQALRPVAGAVFAPKIADGTAFYGALGDGVWVAAGASEPRRAGVRRPGTLEEAYVCVGPDCFLPQYPLHLSLIPRLADRVRTLNACGSCALALAMVAAGQIDALIQPLQSPWDWAAGAALISEAGGVVLFFELSGSELHRVEQLEAAHFDPTKRAVGFVAGHESVAGEILEMLCGLPRKGA